MNEISVTVAAGTEFSTQSTNAVLSITVTNTAAIPAAAGTNAYYVVTLGDGTTTENYTFSVAQTGTISAEHEENFVIENDTLGTVSSSSGVIYYTAA